MSKKIGVGFIGTGFARTVQMPAFKACDDAKLVSVASGSLGNAKAAAETYGIGHSTDDWRETIAHNEVDLVCITTPPRLHKEMVLFSLEHGKHILAEKPMAMNLDEAKEMLAAADGKNVLTLIDHELRFQPGRQTAFNIVREGMIGKVRHARYSFSAPHRGDPTSPWNWWSDINEGGGALGAINSHIIDYFNWMLGTDISSVYCQLQTHVKQRPYGDENRVVTTDDQANMILRFADGELTHNATGLVSVSVVEQPSYVNLFEIFGTEGAIKIGFRGDVHIVKNGETEWQEIPVELAPMIDGVQDTGFARGFMAFAPKIIDAIQNGETEIEHAATFADGVKIQQILDAARESDRSGQAIVI